MPYPSQKIFIQTALFFACFLRPNFALSENLDTSPNLYGQLGLNIAPSARMDEQGMLRAGLSTLDPYLHAWVSAQLAKPLSITLRQSAEISSLQDDAKRLYPGVDIKFRAFEETKTQPEISIGLQSATGHKRMSGEYIALSKRFHDFDLTAGLGWGRYAGAKHFENPLKAVHSHFGNRRAIDGEMPAAPENWFTGEHAGFFAGIEYFTPLKGLSLKLDYGADTYSAEAQDFGYNAPPLWSAGLNYRIQDWADLGLAVQGGQKIMARLSLMHNIREWPEASSVNKNGSPPVPFRPYRTGLTLPEEMRLSAQKEDITLHTLHADPESILAALNLQSSGSTPNQIAQAAKHIANHAGTDIEEINITPAFQGLKGPSISLNRRDLEMARARRQGSAEEIWHSSEIKPASHKLTPSSGVARSLVRREIFVDLEKQFSLSEEDHGVLYRSSLIAGVNGPLKSAKKNKFFGLLNWGVSMRLNIKDNLERIAKIRPRSALPVRSNVDRFSSRTLGLETSYISFTHSPAPGFHISSSGGYLEEMYSGFGGEILYRPFDARWAFGADSWLALKRDPETAFNMGWNGDHILTAHLNGWYDFSRPDITLGLKAGRFLAGDTGININAHKTFKNGTRLEAFSTVSNAVDFDLFGGTTHAHHGLKLSLPLGHFKYTPRNTSLDIIASPFGQDSGQMIKNPMPLYKLTDYFSLKHISSHWDEIAKP